MQIVNNTVYVKYKRPLTLSNKPTGKAWIEELGKSRWTARFDNQETSL